MNNKKTKQKGVSLWYIKGRIAYAMKNYKKAVTWLTKAAEAGHTKSQYYLGLYYETIGQDASKATMWLRKATEAGHKKARMKYPDMLNYNDHDLYTWHRDHGDPEEAERLLDIHERMI